MLLAQLTSDLLLYSILVWSLNFVVGKTSIWSVGHLAFFGIGALTAASILKSVHSSTLAFFLAVVCGAAISAIAALTIGLATLRLRQDFFIILSLAFSELVLAGSVTWKGPTGFDNVARPDIFGISLQNDWAMIGLVLVPFCVLVLFMAQRFANSPLERVCALVRRSEEAAASLQISSIYYKVGCFVIGSTIAGLCGVLFTCFDRATDPAQLTLQKNVLLFAAVLFGGVNSTFGSLLGGVLLVALPKLLEALFFSGTLGSLYAVQSSQFVFGAILLLTIRFLPGGIAAESRLYENTNE